MTLAGQDVPVLAWNEPDGLVPRGTVVVIPGRGELPAVYERFGRRLAGDAYRVRVVADPVLDAELARAQVSSLLADPEPACPAGAGRIRHGRLVRDHAGQIRAGRRRGRLLVDALLLAGLPATPQAGPAASWEEELDARTSCPTHRGRLTASAVRRGALYEPIPAGWLERADLAGWACPSSASTAVTTRSARWGRSATGTPRPPRLNWSASPPAGTTCSTTRPTGPWPPSSCCSWNGSGRTLVRARLRFRSGWGDDKRARRRREGGKHGGWGVAARRDQYPPGGQPESPGTRLWLPEPERSVLHMC